MSDKINRLAMLIALETPERESKWAYSAYVPWHLITELREALEAEGFDYTGRRRRLRQIIAEEKAKKRA